MEKLKNPQTLLKILGIVLMIVIAAVQFLPYWQLEEEAVSINSYVWFPNDHKDVGKYIKAEVGEEVNIYSIIPAPVVTLLFAVLGIAAFAKYPKLPLSAVCGVVVGIVGLWNYLTCPAYALGANQTLHLVLFGVVLAVNALACLLAIIAKVKEA